MNRYTKIRDFHGDRAKGIGSSDIATLAGYTQRWGRTAYTLWEEKTGRREPFGGNERTYWGRMLEGLVLRQWVLNRTGERDTADRFYREYLRNRSYGPYKVNTEARHPEYRFVIAHADLLVADGEGHITEAKSHSFFASIRGDDPDSGYSKSDRSQNGIPAHEFLQVQWQLLGYDVPHGALSALIDTNDYREYGPVNADPRTQEKLLALGERFWWHVENDTPPRPETWDDVAALWPTPEETQAMYSLETPLTEREFTDRKGETITLTGTLGDMLEEREKIAAQRKKLEEREAEIKTAAGVLMGGNKYLTTPDGTVLATRVQTTRESVAAAKVRDGAPELWEKLKEDGYVSESTSDYPKFRKVKR